MKHLSNLEILESRIAPAKIFALTSNNSLLSFDSADPTVTSAVVTITGLGAGESIVAIDVRPATGELYALSIDATIAADDEIGRIYTINATTGEATQVGNAPFSNTLKDGGVYGFDFNPSVDKIRVVNDKEQNLRVNPNDGTLTMADSTLTNVTALVGIAYSGNYANSTATTLYGYNYDTDTLITIAAPNAGVAATVGASGVSSSGSAFLGMDIATDSTGTNTAYLNAANGGFQNFYTMNLTTGAMTLVGKIGDGLTGIYDIAAAAPEVTISASGKTATYKDVDGDTVTVTTTKGQFATSDFSLNLAGPNGVSGGAQLAKVLISDDIVGGVKEFANTSLSFTVKRAISGDGFANVGSIDATGVDLNTVTVRGDLGQIDAGDTTLLPAAIAKLTVQSMGAFGSPSDLNSDIAGKLSSLVVKTDIRGASINVSGTGGAIGSISIGGSIFGGSAVSTGGIYTTGSIGSVKVAGDLVGSGFSTTGAIQTTGSGSKINSVMIGGSLIGGSGSYSGVIRSDSLVSVKVGGSFYGAAGQNSASIVSDTTVGKVSVGGSLFGSSGENSASIASLSGSNSGLITVKGSLIGGGDTFAGSIYTYSGSAGVSVGGSILGGSGAATGTVYSLSTSKLVFVKVGGDIRGNSGSASGSIVSTGEIGAVSVGGDFVATAAGSGLLITNSKLGAVSIKGDLRGEGGFSPLITAAGVSSPSTQAAAMAIKSVTVGGNVSGARIYAGYDLNLATTNEDASIGTVSVKGNWIGSSLVAGIKNTAGFFGDGDDAAIGNNNGLAIATISKITVAGQVSGSSTAADTFAFAAQKIGAVSIGGTAFTLTPGNDVFSKIGTYRDVTIEEITG